MRCSERMRPLAARGIRVQTGAVTVIQRFGSAANLNVHFHCLALDGAYRIGADGRPRFVGAAAPTPARLHALLATMIARLMRLLVRRGVVVAEPDLAWIEETPDRDGDDATDMAPADGPSALPLLNLASTTYRIATGPQAGRRIAVIGGGFCAAGRGGGKPLCAEIAGFTLHAATRCRADDRHRLARLCRYVMRPAFADDQLRWDGGSCVSFELKTPWRDGTTHLEMTPVDFLERLAALRPARSRLAPGPGPSSHRRHFGCPPAPPGPAVDVAWRQAPEMRAATAAPTNPDAHARADRTISQAALGRRARA